MIFTYLLVDCIIFCLLYVPLKRGTLFWINLLLYVIAFVLKSLIFMQPITLSLILMYILVGAIMVWILDKCADSLSPVVFLFCALVFQEVIYYVLKMIIRF